MLNLKILSRIKNFVIGCFTVYKVLVCENRTFSIVPVQIDGLPSSDEESSNEVAPAIVKEKGHIMVLIQNREGLQIKKKHLSYPELKQLVEKLEGLC